MAGSRRFRIGSIRFRTAVAATLVVLLALVVAGWAILSVLRNELVSEIDNNLRIRASEVAILARSGPLPKVFADVDDDGPAVQVVDSSGNVIARSGFVPQHRRLGRERLAPGRSVAQTVDHPPIGDGESYRLVALRPRRTPGITIYATSSLASADDSVSTVRRSLIVATPLLALVVAIVSWLVVRRALRPVEAMRHQVAEITASALDQRIPDPGSRDEIAHLAVTMNEMLDRIDSATSRQRAFVSDASHELRSPLAAIQAQLDVGLAHPDRTDWSNVARQVHSESRRMQRMVDDLLALASADEQGQALRRRPVDVDELVLREVQSVRARAGVAVDISGVEGGRVTGDAVQLERLVRNLIDNAERHARSQVTVSVHRDNGSIEFVVDDDGPGIPAEDRERVFERFTRLDEARTRSDGGTGLGLAIARAVAVAHGGTLTIVDSPRGARFIARVPAAG